MVDQRDSFFVIECKFTPLAISRQLPNDIEAIGRRKVAEFLSLRGVHAINL